MSKSAVISSPDILGGTPVFKGTRVPVKTLFDYLNAGDSIEEFFDDFPSVSPELVMRVLELAQASVMAQAYENPT